MKDYKKDIISSLENNDHKTIETLSIEAFKNEPTNEDLLAFISAIIFEKQIWTCAGLLSEFVDRFPNSLHGIRIYFADLLSKQRKFDSASTEARIYLRIAKENNQFEKPINKIVENSISKGFLLLTSAYTEIGAREYSKRVLDFGINYVSEYWKNIYRSEKKTLENELQNETNQIINKKWEMFFENGSFANELYDLCIKLDFKDLAKRVDLLENQFRFDDKFKIDYNEFLKLIYEQDKAFTLN